MSAPVMRSLRRRVLVAGIAFVGMAAGSLIALALMSSSRRVALDRNTQAWLRKQQISERIVTFMYSQKLAAYRYVIDPSDADLRAFRTAGESAYDQIRQYLFFDLPVEARLEVEGIKEAHQAFEIEAQRALDLVRSGSAHVAHSRLAGLSQRALTLEENVRRFLARQGRAHSAYREEQERLLRGLERATLLAALLLIAAATLLPRFIRKRVLGPLDHIAGAAQRFGAGDDSARVAPQRDAEFAALAAGFNDMAERVVAGRRDADARNARLSETLDRLQQAQHELVQHEKLSAMGMMLAGLAHELNNPLTGVLGFSECLKAELSESPEPASREMATRLASPLVHEALRARDFVRNLLQFSRKSKTDLEPVNLAQAVEVAVAVRRHEFKQAEAELRVAIESSLFVEAEAQRLQHVVVNVINNALDVFADRPGHVLLIHAERNREWVELSFDDNGPGFSDPSRVFEPFYTTKPVGSGTGLGLSLVHDFIHEFGGSVAATNRPLGGARICIRLKAAAPRVERRTPATNVPVPSAVREPAHRRPRVLVVDDEPAIREIQRRMLDRAGVDVVLASSGAGACDLVNAQTFDLVISDIRMPGTMDGLALIEWLRGTHPQLAERVMVVTGDVHGRTGGSPLPVPAERVLAKPFERQEYVRRVLAALDRGTDS